MDEEMRDENGFHAVMATTFYYFYYHYFLLPLHSS